MAGRRQGRISGPFGGHLPRAMLASLRAQLVGDSRRWAGAGGLCRSLAVLGLATGVAVSSAQLAAATPPPGGVSADAEVDRAQGAFNAAVSELANANVELDQLDAAVETKQQEAVKAAWDLRAAQAAAGAAGQRASSAQDELRGAQAQVQLVRGKADELIGLMYTNAGALSPELALFEASGVRPGLDRAALLQELAAHQRQTVEEAQRARNDEANRAAALNSADREAQHAAAAAQAAKQACDQAAGDAVAAADALRGKREALLAARDEAQRALDEAREAATPPATAAPDPAQQAAGPAAQQPPAQEQSSGQNAPATLNVEQQLAQQVAAQAPDLAPLILGGATLAADPVAPAAGGYVPRLSGPMAVETVIRRGLTQIGHIYSWGGGSAYGPTRGIHDGGVADRYGDYMKSGYDCSGLMIYAFAGAGILLPHYTGYQYRAGRQVPASQMRRGDMIFYGANASQHVTLYLGNGWMLESPQSGEAVHVTRLRTGGMTPYVVRMF